MDRAGEFGLLVMLDMHRLSPDEEITPLWYDDLHTYEDYLTAWENVMKVFAGKWNVFALGELIGEGGKEERRGRAWNLSGNRHCPLSSSKSL